MPVPNCPSCGGPVSECGGKTFVSHYYCPGNLEYRKPHDPVEWEGTWCCACDDKCPECNAEIEPHEVDEPEAESQASKHADAGYMNDMRFGEGDGPDY